MLAHGQAIEALEWDPHNHCLASVGNSELHIWKISPDQSMYKYYSSVQSLFITFVESFVALASNTEKQPYVTQSENFLDNGASVLVSYLKSRFIYVVYLTQNKVPVT